MPQVRGELHHVGKMALLGCRQGVRAAVEGVHEWLVVRENCKLEAFQNLAKMANCRVARQQLSVERAVLLISRI